MLGVSRVAGLFAGLVISSHSSLFASSASDSTHYVPPKVVLRVKQLSEIPDSVPSNCRMVQSSGAAAVLMGCAVRLRTFSPEIPHPTLQRIGLAAGAILFITAEALNPQTQAMWMTWANGLKEQTGSFFQIAAFMVRRSVLFHQEVTSDDTPPAEVRDVPGSAPEAVPEPFRPRGSLTPEEIAKQQEWKRFVNGLRRKH